MYVYVCISVRERKREREEEEGREICHGSVWHACVFVVRVWCVCLYVSMCGVCAPVCGVCMFLCACTNA